MKGSLASPLRSTFLFVDIAVLAVFIATMVKTIISSRYIDGKVVDLTPIVVVGVIFLIYLFYRIHQIKNYVWNYLFHVRDVLEPDSVRCNRQGTENIIVVGAGVAGCSIAYALASKGHLVTLIERDWTEQDRIVGELLQPGGLNALERLGLDDCVKEGIESIMVEGYAVFDPPKDSSSEPRTILLKYPRHYPQTFAEFFGLKNDSERSEKEPQPKGRSFHNGRFVNRLREKCKGHKSITCIEGTVSQLIEENGIVKGVEYKIKQEDGSTASKSLRSHVTIVADGIFSNFRKGVSGCEIKRASSFVGVVVKHPPNQSPVPFPYHGHVVLTNPSPSLIYQISPTETRVLIDVLGDLPTDLKGHMLTVVAPQLPVAFRECFITAINNSEGNLKMMHNRFCHASPPKKQGVLLVGDALNMRHPLTGGGMTVAIRDGELLSRLIGDIDFSGPLDRQFDYSLLARRYSQFLEDRKGYACTVNVLSVALHGVFTSPGGDPARELLREGCFEYLQQGDFYAAGPVGLLAAITPKPIVLVIHFFMVAVHAARKCFWDKFSFRAVYNFHRLIRIACTIIMPLLKAEKSTFLSWPFFQSFVNIAFPKVKQDHEAKICS